VISASASMGTVSKVGPEVAGAIPYTGIIRFRPRTARIVMEFVRYFLQSTDFLRQVDAAKTGTAIQHFGPTHLDAMFAPHQPVEYQVRAVASMSRASQHFAASRDALASQIELLQEHRQALITAAVTGELDIPGVAAYRANRLPSG